HPQTTTLPSLPFLSHAPPPPPTSPLSLHDALPISAVPSTRVAAAMPLALVFEEGVIDPPPPAAQVTGKPLIGLLPRSVTNTVYADRKSTRLNSSHEWISYAVFCLKKKKIQQRITHA